MRVGIVLPAFDQFANGAAFRQLAETIEELGFDSAWFGDHIVFPADRPDYIGSSWLEPVACAIQGLGMTSRLSFGTDVLVAPYRNPLMLAKMAVTASELSGGRLILGMGIGWLEGEFRALGVPPFSARAQATEEYLEVMRMMFEQEGPLSYGGRWVSFEDVLFEPRPSHPIPLLVGGNHVKALRRAALLGDGWHPLFLEPEDYARGRAEIERIRREEGIARPFTFSLSGPQARILPGGGSVGRSQVAKEGTSYAPPVGTDEQGRPRFVGTAEQVRDDCLEMA
ncbi:MAG: TIGR03619 family F420-dependent LLM class oxidoreductase, partial [Novosphingobium sp.]|nr:TIGR03619 family F420-dependent LLM class oxidoreductase [Novosphingobium sp.]